jgi:hypothetical protein
MARDWEEIIAVVQADRVERATVQFSAPASPPATDTNGHGHAEPAAVGAGDDLPADPFG